MTTVLPVDDYVATHWYPGFGPADSDTPWLFERLGVFAPEDAERLWALDFHGIGLVPLSWLVIEEGAVCGSQLAAETIPLPTGKGLVARIWRTNIYTSEVPVRSAWEQELRGRRAAQTLPRLVDRAPQAWAEAVEELEAFYDRLREPPAADADLADLRAYFDEAATLVRRAWQIHFETMYVLLANHLGFLGLCRELGIDPDDVARFFQGEESRIVETDRELWRLTGLVRDLGLEELFASTPADELAAALAARDDEPARRFRDELRAFLDVYGWRTEGIYDVALVPWIEDPTSPLGTIKTHLLAEEAHDFEAARAAALAERDAAIAAARDRLTVEEQQAFDAGLAACRHANFTWWNEEHNFYIDLRCHIPLRQAALAIGRRFASDPTDAFYLFPAEMRAVLRGERSWDDAAAIVPERRAYREACVADRTEAPRILGTIPEDVDDPVLKEIFGISPDYLAAIAGRAAGGGEELRGMAASAGVARGPARVLLTAEELHTIRPGEILVCEATSPNWTPAFAKIAACVCDAGGSLTHAAIVSREYRLPCVTGTGAATAAIATGDLVEVDGAAGRVTILERAALAAG